MEALVNPIDIIEGIIRFRGFKEVEFKKKMKWILVLYPFALIVLLVHLILWIPFLPIMLIDKFRKIKFNKRRGIYEETKVEKNEN